MISKKSGFTLIELLVVITIIVILSVIAVTSIGPAQRSARDANRIASMREAQTLIQLYYQKCGIFPGKSDCSCATAGADVEWEKVKATLNAAAASGTIPDDPISTRHFFYAQEENCTGYVLGARLEGPNGVLNNDIDKISDLPGTYKYPGTAPAGAPNGCSDPLGTGVGADVVYCIGV